MSAGAAMSMPLAGMRSDIPQPRARTPSPIRKVNQLVAPPAPARDFEIDTAKIDVIYAEDEEVFRETAVRELLKVGFCRANIHESENGLGALEHLARLQVEGNAANPLLVLLDVRMPSMDGRECALQIQELVKKRLLRREPFVVCISSIHKQVVNEEGRGNFQVVIPKPFGTAYLTEAIELLRQWWTLGHGRQLSAWKEFNPSDIEIIAADDTPVCRMSSTTAFVQAGALNSAIEEAEDEPELLEKLEEAQEGDATRPLIVLLGKDTWAPVIRNFVESLKLDKKIRREPFVVCTSVDSDRIGSSQAVEHYHAFLPRAFTQSDVKWCLEFCRLWWLTRGDGPQPKEEDAEEDSGSEGSDDAQSVMSGD